MANLTIVVDDQLLRSARIKAVADGTSVNEICRLAIERYAAVDQKREQRLERLFALAGQIAGAPGPGWPGREALYAEARTAPRGETPKFEPQA